MLVSCSSCLLGKVEWLRSSTDCSLKCPFCFYYGGNKTQVPLYTNQYRVGPQIFTLEGMMQYFDRFTPRATAWVSKEPLEHMEKIPELMRHLSDLGVYQYLYTNGLHATDENLQILQDCGLNEIRFNLQATEFSQKIISRMAEAKKYIKHLVVEVPMFTACYDNLVKHHDQIVDIGIDQLNLNELQIGPANIVMFAESEGELYRHRGMGHISPVIGQELVTKIKKLDWGCWVNNCSNNLKYFRDRRKHGK